MALAQPEEPDLRRAVGGIYSKRYEAQQNGHDDSV